MDLPHLNHAAHTLTSISVYMVITQEKNESLVQRKEELKDQLHAVQTEFEQSEETARCLIDIFQLVLKDGESF